MVDEMQDHEGSASCDELRDLVTDYAEGALAPAESHRLEAHVAHCPDCAGYVAEMRLAIRAAGKLADDETDPTTLDRLVGVYRAWKRNR